MEGFIKCLVKVCQAVKRVFFTSIYLTLIINLGMICYLKECTQSKAVTCQE